MSNNGNGLDVLGIAPKGKPSKPAPRGRTSASAPQGGKSPHKLALARANAAVARAQNAAKGTSQKAGSYAPKAHAPVVPLARVAPAKVRKGGRVLIGFDWGVRPEENYITEEQSDFLSSGEFADKQADYAQARPRGAAPAPKSIIPVAVPRVTNGPIVDVIGEVISIFGTTKALTPKQQQAVKRHTDAVAKTAATAVVAKAKAARAAAVAKAVQGAIKPTVPKIDKLTKAKSPKTRIGAGGSILGWDMDASLESDMAGATNAEGVMGWDESVIGGGLDLGGCVGYDEVAAAAMDAGRDINQVIMEMEAAGVKVIGGEGDGESEDSVGHFWDIVGDDDSPAPPQLGPDGSTPTDPGTGDVPAPIRGQTLSQADAQVLWHKVPEDGVVYDGAKGMPDGSVGSYGWFYGPGGVTTEDGIVKGTGNKTGYIYTRRGTHFGSNQDTPRWMGQNNDDNVHDVNDDGTLKDFGWGDLFKSSLMAAIPFYAIYDFHAIASKVASGGGDATASTVNRASVAAGWGPLIGNPQGDLAGLQFAIEDGKWFWQAQNAPAWATAEADAALALLNKKAAEANAAAAAAEQARKDQIAAEQAEAQAKQDAQNALAQSAADTASNIAQQQVSDKQAATDASSQAAQQDTDAKQAQIDLEQQKIDQQMAAQQAQLDLQLKKAQIASQIAAAQAAVRAAQAPQDDGGDGAVGPSDSPTDWGDPQDDGGDGAVGPSDSPTDWGDTEQVYDAETQDTAAALDNLDEPDDDATVMGSL